MRKNVIFTAWIMAIALVSPMNGTALADVITPLNPQMQENLQNLSKILVSLSNELSTGKMPVNAQEAAAEITKQLGQILQDLSEGKREFDAQKKGIDEMMKMWQPFTESSLTGN
ncbi:MAG: hypothetical protein QNJ58_00265 [Desulfobacterales bacterium]|nr:hypothetical protein [Desulfobacterales bacterium]